MRPDDHGASLIVTNHTPAGGREHHEDQEFDRGLWGVLALLLTGGPVTLADEAPGAASSTNLTVKAPSRGAQPAISTGVLTGCIGQAGNPWHAGTNAQSWANTVCSGWPTDTTASLTRDRWYGSDVLAVDRSDGVGYSYASPFASCYREGTYTYRQSSAHHAVQAGRSGWGYLYTAARFTC